MKNAGVEKATEAARAIGARLAVPDERGDFNDLWQHTDDDEARRQRALKLSDGGRSLHEVGRLIWKTFRVR